MYYLYKHLLAPSALTLAHVCLAQMPRAMYKAVMLHIELEGLGAIKSIDVRSIDTSWVAGSRALQHTAFSQQLGGLLP